MDRLTVGSQQHRFRLQTKLNRTVVSAKAEIKCREVRRPSGIDSLIRASPRTMLAITIERAPRR